MGDPKLRKGVLQPPHLVEVSLSSPLGLYKAPNAVPARPCLKGTGRRAVARGGMVCSVTVCHPGLDRCRHVRLHQMNKMASHILWHWKTWFPS